MTKHKEPMTIEHRAKIAASKALRARGESADENPERWSAEYDIALFRLKRLQELETV